MNIPEIYNQIKKKVVAIYQKLHLKKYEASTGRPLAIPITEILTLSLYKQKKGIPTKKSIWDDFKKKLNCSYKTFVVNLNRFSILALVVLLQILRLNKNSSHIIKHLDSTCLPVCLNKNAKNHKTMKGLAKWGHSGKGLYYGLKLHLCSDLARNILSICFTPANTDDRKMVEKLTKDLKGLFIADAGYVSDKLAYDFHHQGKGFLLAKPRKNMKKLMDELQCFLSKTRVMIEFNFRDLKMFYGFVTSLPRSINGYFANYIYSLLAYTLSK